MNELREPKTVYDSVHLKDTLEYIEGGKELSPGSGFLSVADMYIPPPYGRTSRVWDSLIVMKYACAGGRGFAPRPGAIVGRVFHPTRKLVRFSFLKCPSIPNLKKNLKYVVPVGGV